MPGHAHVGKAAFTHACLAQAVVDPGGTFLLVNQALSGLLGRPPAALVGMTEAAVSDPVDRGVDVLGGKQVVKRYRDAAGTTVWARVTCTPLGDGGPDALLQLEDVTETVRLRRELQDSDVRLHVVLGNAPISYFVVDREGRVVKTGGAALTALERLRAGSPTSLFDAYADAGLVAGVRRALDGETLRGTQEISGNVYDVRFVPVGMTQPAATPNRATRTGAPSPP